MKVNGRNLTLISRLCYPITLLPTVVNENRRILLPSDFVLFTKVFCVFKSFLCFSGNQQFSHCFHSCVNIFHFKFWLHWTSFLYFLLNFYSSHSHQVLKFSATSHTNPNLLKIKCQLWNPDSQLVIWKLLLLYPLWENKSAHLSVELL